MRESHEGAAAGTAGAASEPSIAQGLQQNAASSVRRYVAVGLLLVLFSVFVDAALFDETHVLGINPEVTGCQHLPRFQSSWKKQTDATSSVALHICIFLDV